MRLPEVEKQRKELPIYMEEQRIMEGIKENDVVVICGGTQDTAFVVGAWRAVRATVVIRDHITHPSSRRDGIW